MPLLIPLIAAGLGFGGGFIASGGLNKIIVGAVVVGGVYYFVVKK